MLGDLDELVASDRFRFANRLEAWIEVEDGRIVDAGQRAVATSAVTKVGYGSASIAFAPIAPCPTCVPTPSSAPAGPASSRPPAGRTGIPTPRRVRHEPYVQIGGP